MLLGLCQTQCHNTKWLGSVGCHRSFWRAKTGSSEIFLNQKDQSIQEALKPWLGTNSNSSNELCWIWGGGGFISLPKIKQQEKSFTSTSRMERHSPGTNKMLFKHFSFTSIQQRMCYSLNSLWCMKMCMKMHKLANACRIHSRRKG